MFYFIVMVTELIKRFINMNRWVAMFVFFYLGSFSAYAQNNSTINVETGLFYSYGQYNNPIINIGDYHDQIYFIIGYQKVNPQFNYSVRLGLMEDNLTEEFEGSQNSESAFFGWRSWSPIGKKTILFELQTTVKWLNNKSKLLPLLDIGISTLILAQKTGGGTSIGDSKSIYQILSEFEYKRKINPFFDCRYSI